MPAANKIIIALGILIIILTLAEIYGGVGYRVPAGSATIITKPYIVTRYVTVTERISGSIPYKTITYTYTTTVMGAYTYTITETRTETRLLTSYITSYITTTKTALVTVPTTVTTTTTSTVTTTVTNVTTVTKTIAKYIPIRQYNKTIHNLTINYSIILDPDKDNYTLIQLKPAKVVNVVDMIKSIKHDNCESEIRNFNGWKIIYVEGYGKSSIELELEKPIKISYKAIILIYWTGELYIPINVKLICGNTVITPQTILSQYNPLKVADLRVISYETRVPQIDKIRIIFECYGNYNVYVKPMVIVYDDVPVIIIKPSTGILKYMLEKHYCYISGSKKAYCTITARLNVKAFINNYTLYELEAAAGLEYVIDFNTYTKHGVIEIIRYKESIPLYPYYYIMPNNVTYTLFIKLEPTK